MHAYKTPAPTFPFVSPDSTPLRINRGKHQAIVRSLKVRLQPVSDHDRAFLSTINAEIERQVDNADLGIKELMAAVHLSHSQLFRRLKTITGMNPTAYIRNIRLKKAKRLLVSTDWQVAEIAYTLGFTDPNYFSRAFRKEFGCSPKTARANG